VQRCEQRLDVVMLESLVLALELKETPVDRKLRVVIIGSKATVKEVLSSAKILGTNSNGEVALPKAAN
jgi:hypothetical protein